MKKLIIALSIFLFGFQAFSQNPGDVLRYKKIGNNLGNLGNVLGSSYFFGASLENIGDINGDGITDMAASIHGKSPYGGLYILFMDTNGTVQSKTLLTQNTNGISGLQSSGSFGCSISTIGDINNDGVNDIAVGALGISDGGSSTGGIYIICLNSSGVAISQQKISKTVGNSSGGGLPLQVGGHFGCDLTYLGDLNSDGKPEIAVGNSWDDQAGQNYGAFWILSIDTNKKVSSSYKIRKGVTNFNPSLSINDYFGQSVEGIGDFDGDGIPDIASGAIYDDDGNTNAGAVYIIHLNANSTVKNFTKLSNSSFTGTPLSGTFGTSITVMPDISGDGHKDLAVGAPRHPYSSDRGAVYIIKFGANETIDGYKKITYPEIPNPNLSRLGRGICCMDDYNSDGYPEIVTDAPNENSDKGALYIMSIKTLLSVTVTATHNQCFDGTSGMAVAVGHGTNPPFTYLWSNGSTNDTISNLATGSYTVTMTNSVGKTANSTVNITSPSELTTSPSANTSICEGESTLISCISSGGTGSKTYHWNQGLGNAPYHSVTPQTTQTYTVYATDANNCSSDTNDIIITVNSLPTASFTGLNVAYCSNANAVNLSGSPSGGVFSGPGISSSVFNPASANTGINQIIYAYTDVNGCVGKDTNTTNIFAAPDVQFSGISSAYCTNDADVALNGKASPSGGAFWVNNISSTIFSPSTSGAGTYYIRYKVSNAAGCTDVDSVTTFVNPSPTASFSGLAAAYCENNSSVALNGSPSGGSFVGPGISGTSFFPANAGLGSKNVKYIYSNMFGCSDTAVNATVVNAITPLTVSTPKSIFCNNDAAVSISVSPSGGTLSGIGVNNSAQTFNPATAGTGAKTILYTFVNPHGCTSTESYNVTVNTPATLSISGLAASYCANNSAASLSGSPSGGSFFGTAVIGNTFNPITAGVGTHTVSYRYDNGCVDTLHQNVIVYGLPTVSISGLAADYCESVVSVSLSGSPTGGSFYGAGILGSIFNPNDAGPGTHLISYISGADSHGCIDTTHQSVVVNTTPIISFGTMTADQCIDGSSVSLTASPTGGSYSGTGVTGSTFNPSTAGIGTHQVTYAYTDANSCSSTAFYAFTVHNLPSITFNVGSSCANITAMNLSAAPSGGSFTGSFVSGSIFNPAAAGTGSHQVIYSYTDTYLCSNTDTQIIVVNIIPTVSFSLSNADFCIDANSVNLSASPNGGSYTGSGISGSTFSPANAGVGSHDLVYSFTDGNLCSNSDTATAIVHASPTVSISNYNTTNCSNNQNDTLTGLPSSGSFTGTGMTGSIFSPITAGVGTHQIVYAYSDAFQCANSDTVSITVYAPPSIVISSGLNTTNCKNDAPYALTISPAGGTYTGSFIMNDTFYPNLAPTGYTGYIYMYTDANGCTGAIDDSAFVYNNPTINAGTDTLLPCGSNGATIGEIAEANHTYIWSPIAGLNNPFTSNPVANPWVDTTVFVVVKTNSNTNCSAKDSVMITLPELPVVSISGDTVVCTGDSIHLSVVGNDAYLWKYGVSGNNFDQVLPITQYISVVATDLNNCIAKDSVVVLVNPLPQPNLGADTAIFDNQTLTLNAGTFPSYQWNTGQTSQTIDVEANTLSPGNYNYAVSVKNNYGCENADTIVISITTGIAEHNYDANIKVYPNPTKGMVNLEWSDNLSLQMVEVYDSYGKLIQSLPIENNLLKTQINLQNLAKGAYLLHLKGDKFAKVVKVVVE